MKFTVGLVRFLVSVCLGVAIGLAVVNLVGCASKRSWPPSESKNYEYGSVDRH